MQAQSGAKSEPGDGAPQTGVAQVTKRMAAWSPRRLARIAGGLYLINIVGGFFAEGYVPAALVVSGDAAATARNILTHELIYRLGIVAHIIVLLTNIPLAVIFYDLFKVVNRRLALLVVFFTLVGTAIEGVTVLAQFAPLILLEGEHSLSVFHVDQLQALANTSLDLQAIGFNISLVFFVGYDLSLGYLMFRSTFLPRILGALLVVGGLCYLTYSFTDFLAPGFAAQLVPYIQLPSGLAELSLCLWLLVMGVNAERWKAQASKERS